MRTQKIFHCILTIAFCLPLSIFGQVTEGETKLRTQTSDTTEGWRKGGTIAINLSQTSLTNWASGGQKSVSVNGVLSAYANYKKGSAVWDNSLDVGYGILQQGNNKTFMKTDDKIDLLSKYGQQAFNHWYYAALLNLKTQMTAGYNYPNDSVKISNLFAPVYIIGAIGLDYKPNKYFSLFVAPMTSKSTIVNDQTLADAGSFGVEKAAIDTSTGAIIKHGLKSRNEFGGYIRIIYSKNDFEYELLKNVSLTTKLDLFSNYMKQPQNIDVSWESLITFKVNKFINVNFNTHLIYDDDIKIGIDSNNDGIVEKTGPRIQFKEILGVGFAVKF